MSQRISNLIDDAASQLRDAGVDTPSHDAKLLLAAAYGCSLSDVDKAMLMGRGVEALGESVESNDKALQQFSDMVARRVKREPLQYITGHAPFRYLDLLVGEGVFIPRPETETVVQVGLDWITQQGMYSPRVADLCAGSGAIGLAVASEVPGSQVWAVEISERTAEWTRKNLAQTAKRYPSIASNWHLEVADATQPTTLAHLDGTMDMVITNPPYIPQTNIPEQPEVRDWDPDLALYGGSAAGTLVPERIITRAFNLLKPGGVLIMEHDISQGDRLVAFANATGFESSHTGEDLTGRPRYLFAQKPAA